MIVGSGLEINVIVELSNSDQAANQWDWIIHVTVIVRWNLQVLYVALNCFYSNMNSMCTWLSVDGEEVHSTADVTIKLKVQ